MVTVEVPQTLEYRGGQLNAAPVLKVENFTNWKKRFMCHILAKSTWDDMILYHEGPFDVKESRVMNIKLCYNIFKFKEGETPTQTFTRYKALMNELVNDGIKLSKLEINTGLRSTNHVKDSELSSLFHSLDDEEDTRSSREYLNDLEEEYQASALLAKSKRFFKKGTQRFSSAKATDQTKCHKCGKKGHFARDCWSKASVPSYQSPFQPKPLSSSQHKPELRPTKDFEAKYNKVKVKRSLLSSSALALKAATVKNKAEENDAISKEGARNGEWVKIYMRKVHTLLEMEDNDDRKTYLDYLCIDLNYVEEQRNNILSKHRDLVHELNACKEQVPIFYDNTSAIAISNNPVMHSRTKHIDIRYHFIRDRILKEDIELHFIPTQYQLVDIFTKPLDEPTFKRLIVELAQIPSSPDVTPKEEPITLDRPKSPNPFVLVDQVEFSFKEIALTTNNEVALQYPSHSNLEYFKVMSDFISKCCLKEAFTRAPTQYKEYLCEFWYIAKTLNDSKIWVSTPTSGIRGDICITTFRNALRAHYLPHSSMYVPSPSITVVRPWFATIGYSGEIRAKGTLKKSFLPLRVEVDYAKLIWEDIIHKLNKKTREKVFSVLNWALKPNQHKGPPFTDHTKAICNIDMPVDSQAPTTSSQTEKVPQGKKPGAKSGL
ncbi:retrovirus-related pol polyprotein from transposon TNT 1-94 [Tanacetum coccineum]